MRQNNNKISAIVITYNEIGYIERCVSSITFADEIIVVDSNSTDGTFEFLHAHPKVKVIQKPFENFTKQKSFALEQASNDWVLFLDADEVLTSRLQEEIKKTVDDENSAVAYWCYKKFMFKNKPLHFCGWRSDKNYRLFRKSKVRFTSKRIVHETLEVNGKTAILKEKLIHYSFKNYKHYRAKMLSYGRLKAKEAYMKEKPFRYSQLLCKPLWKFFYHYVLRLGILDTKKGLIISYLAALGEVERYVELRRLNEIPKATFSYKTLEA